ncbi:MAG: LysE family translocator [Panacagrimonas sp.]
MSAPIPVRRTDPGPAREYVTDGLALFGAVAAAHALGVASPGPDFAMVIRQTLAHGRRVGVLTALGIGSGIVFHVAWGMFGLGWAIQRFPALLDVLRYGGAAFLLWMGVNALRSKPSPTIHRIEGERPGPDAGAASRAYLVGLATNLLNPKALLFFVALCSSVVTAGASAALRLGLGLWLACATAAWFSVVAFTAGHEAVRGRLAQRAWLIDRAMGVVLVGLGLAVMTS